jgi:predicted lipoprotein
MNDTVRCLAFLAALTAATPSFAVEDATAKAVVAKAVDLYIRPAYKDFHDKAHALAEETSDLCAQPSDERLKSVGARFAETIDSWGRIEILRDGPVLAENRFERVLFYPDRKSTGLKQVQALLAKQDETVTDAAALKTRSVAIQGLGAFEYVFFGAYPEGLVSGKDSFRCRYGLAIARNVEGIGGELQAAWDAPDGIQAQWKSPSADNPVFRDGAEAIQALVGLHVHGLEMVRDQRIKPFYKGRGLKITPRAAVFWRSANTMTLVGANIKGLETLWKVSDMRTLLPEDTRSMADAIDFDYRSAATAAARLGQPTTDALADVKYLARLDFIEFNLKDAIARINTDVSKAIGLGAGFSFADGD